MDRESYKKKKKQEAEVRERDYNKLTIKEKIAQLDNKLGKGVGAVKQREKLARALKNESKEE